MRIFVTGNCSFPTQLMAALVRRAPAVRDVEIVQVLTVGNADYVQPGMQEHLRLNALFIGANVRAAVNDGRADFTPIFLSEIPKLSATGVLPLDVALVQVSPPDEHGFCSFGVEVDITKPAAECARIVIAEVNAAHAAHAGRQLHPRRKHRPTWWRVDCPLPRAPHAADTGACTSRSATHIADLIEDGATLQIGIGAIPDAVLQPPAATSATWASTPRCSPTA